jgi:hypothetical protein
VETAFLGKHKGLGELGSMIIIALIMGVIVIGGTIFYGNAQSKYGVSFTNASDVVGINEPYTKLNSTISSIGSDIKGSDAQSSNPFSILFSGAFESIRRVFGLIDVFTSLASGMGGFFYVYLGADVVWFVLICLGIFGAYLTFRLLEIVLGRAI